MRRTIQALALNLLFAGTMLGSQQQVPVPQVDADLGPCTVAFTVSQGNSKPLFNAEISVKISYGFMGMKKMDLKVGTNNEGKARFVGLPDKVHNPPLTFVVHAEGMTKSVNYWPSVKCQARYSIVMDGR